MRTLKWVAMGLLIWGLFIGIAFVLTPIVTDEWGNATSLFAGVGLVFLCSLGLLKLKLGRQHEPGQRLGG